MPRAAAASERLPPASAMAFSRISFSYSAMVLPGPERKSGFSGSGYSGAEVPARGMVGLGRGSVSFRYSGRLTRWNISPVAL